jgi:transposase
MASPTLTQPQGADHAGVVIGVDTHKEFHVAVALAPNGRRLGECSIPANRQGYGVLQDWALELGSRPVFAIEGTGTFGAGLCRELLAAGCSVVEINRPDRSTRRRLGKDDAAELTWLK